MSVRALRIVLRTAHLTAFGALYGGHVYGAAPTDLHPALLATVGTGLALIGMEAVRSPIWFVQIRGLATLLKIALTISIAVFWPYRIAILTTVTVIGSVSSHMPGRFRYWSILHRGMAGDQESG